MRKLLLLALLLLPLRSYAQSLDTNAWLLPNGGIALAPSGMPYMDSPGVCVQSAQTDLMGSILNLHAIYSSISCPAAAFGGPYTLPLRAGTIFWKNQLMLYGTVEASVKLMGAGVHTTFWLFDANEQSVVYQLPPTAIEHDEVDIAEAAPFVYSDTTTLKQNIFGSSTHQLTTTVTDYSTNFHTYKMTWTPTSVTWYVDGVQSNQVLSGLPTHPMFVIMDVEAADAASGDVVMGNFPQNYQVQYVKAWDSTGKLIFQDNFNGASAYVQQSILASYDFANTENPLSDGGNFTTIADASFTGMLQVLAPNFCNATTDSAIAGSYWSGSIVGGGSWPASQFSEARIGTMWASTSYLILNVRQGAAASGTHYLLVISNDTGVTGWSLQAIVSGTTHVLATGMATSAAADVWRLSVKNNAAGHPVLSIIQNLTTLSSFTDTNNYILTAGSPGFGLLGADGVASWVGGTVLSNSTVARRR